MNTYKTWPARLASLAYIALLILGMAGFNATVASAAPMNNTNIASTTTTAPAADAGSKFFPETAQTMRGLPYGFWTKYGGLPVFGYPITGDQLMEGGYRVQYTERARFEIHPEHAGTIDEVQLGLLGSELYYCKYGNGPAPGEYENSHHPWSRYVPETKHWVGGLFAKYYSMYDLRIIGYPVSGELQEMVEGRLMTVQYFQRVRMEYHPEYQGTPSEVLFTQLGTMKRGGQICNGPAPAPAPNPNPAPNPGGGGKGCMDNDTWTGLRNSALAGNPYPLIDLLDARPEKEDHPTGGFSLTGPAVFWSGRYTSEDLTDGNRTEVVTADGQEGVFYLKPGNTITVDSPSGVIHLCVTAPVPVPAPGPVGNPPPVPPAPPAGSCVDTSRVVNIINANKVWAGNPNANGGRIYTQLDELADQNPDARLRADTPSIYAVKNTQALFWVRTGDITGAVLELDQTNGKSLYLPTADGGVGVGYPHSGLVLCTPLNPAQVFPWWGK